jgi:integrase
VSKNAKSQVNFTKASLEALKLPPVGQRFYYYDTRGNGLHVAVTSKGQKSFYIRRRVNGKNEKHLIGSYPDLSVEQARDKAARFTGAVAFGDNPAEQRRILRGELTLGELFDEYLERHLKKSRKTWVEYEKQFKRYFEEWLGRKLSTISQQDVERRHRELGGQRGTYAANRALQLIRALYNKGLAWGLYQGANPGVGITMFEERSRERVLQSDEFERFFKTLDQEEEEFSDFVMLTLLTGARKSRVMAMSWDAISLKRATWTIPAEQAKNGRMQVIVLTEAEMDILHRRHEENAQRAKPSKFVFAGSGETGHLTDIKHSWTTFCARSRLSDLHIHDLRRSLASWMASTGANVSVIRSALNHKDVKTTLTVYARANQQSELAARELAHKTMLEFGKSGSVVPLKKREKGTEF